MNVALKLCGDYDKKTSVRLRVKLSLETLEGDVIHRADLRHEYRDLLAVPQLDRVLTKFNRDWRWLVADPVHAAIDARRIQLYEKAQADGPLIHYPADIDFARDAEALNTGPMVEIAEREEFTRKRLAALLTPPV